MTIPTDEELRDGLKELMAQHEAARKMLAALHRIVARGEDAVTIKACRAAIDEAETAGLTPWQHYDDSYDRAARAYADWNQEDR